MKRTITLLAAATGLVGAGLTGVAPASAAAPSPVDCHSPEYTRVLESYVPTNEQRLAVDGRAYAIAGPQGLAFKVCVDIPDNATFAIEVRQSNPNGSSTVLRDNRPGDKVFSYSIPPNTLSQVYGTMTGPSSAFTYYTWAEKRTP